MTIDDRNDLYPSKTLILLRNKSNFMKDSGEDHA